jgi:hypothetical protein
MTPPRDRHAHIESLHVQNALRDVWERAHAPGG